MILSFDYNWWMKHALRPPLKLVLPFFIRVKSAMITTKWLAVFFLGNKPSVSMRIHLGGEMSRKSSNGLVIPFFTKLRVQPGRVLTFISIACHVWSVRHGPHGTVHA